VVDPKPPKIRHIRQNCTRHQKSAEKSSAKPDIGRILMKYVLAAGKIPAKIWLNS